MIRRIRHKGLKALYEKGDSAALSADWAPRIRRILSLLDAASDPAGMDVPGLHCHRLKGDYEGFWSVRVTGNWRVVWRFDEGDATDVDLTDYH